MSEKHFFADTSFLIDLFKGEEKAIEIVEEADTIATGTVCLYELSKIAEFDREKLSANRIKKLTDQDAEKAASMHRDLARKGEKISEIDYLIAAQAENSGRKLVTRDQDYTKLDTANKTYRL